ncbi:HTH-type transcriptional repressor CsiR [Maioricimonas rarisocia]|uniref:HTH-type transcriptional repressor CsiR n=1 Tax=Maioricimonas rarisocia TaxID=2528026 RepID=A0A517ZEP2_9PLAN|nr:GntR family transcriptional regulator [Maioricimonas rarisocia]QDU40924.1 HTH-type transcriptional repressor CsiR [Maioricimonas rarisocia]
MARRECMSDGIRNELTARILDGRLQPGARLVELAIASEFETSQAPVREALRELEAHGLVESQPYRGTRVREITNREMAEAYQVRAILEQHAGEQAAARFEGNVADLDDLVRRLRTAAAAGDVEAYSDLNVQFHRCILERSGNQTLLKMWETLGFGIRIRVNVVRQSVDLPRRADEHDPIVDALRAGDGPKAGRLLREHVESFIPAWQTADASVPQTS